MQQTRLTSSARRDLIVDAAVPLFARKGFAGTTTREIAEAAGVSEALVFKYFANKTALYDAIVQQCKRDHPTFEDLKDLAPSTYSLVKIIRVTTEYMVSLIDNSEMVRARYRMFLRSLSEDGDFARVGMDAYSAEMRAVFEQCFEAARHAGDLLEDAPNATNAFWTLSQFQFMMVAWRLPTESIAPQIPLEDGILAILRGIGLTKDAMRQYADGAYDAAVLRTPDMARAMI